MDFKKIWIFKRNHRKIYLTLFIFTVFLFVSVLPTVLLKISEKKILKKCPHCSLRVGFVIFNPLKTKILINNILYKSDSGEDTWVSIFTSQATVHFRLLSLFKDPLEIYEIEIKDAKVTITENHEKKHANKPAQLDSSSKGYWLKTLPVAKINSLSLRDSELNYVLKIFHAEARLKISEIQAQLSPLGTRGDLGVATTYLKLKAKLEETGSITLNIKTSLFSPLTQDQIDLEVRHQKMHELNRFFGAEDGISMGGEVDQAQAAIFMSEDLYLSGTLRARYQALSLDFHPNPETSSFQAGLANIIKDLKIEKTKPLDHHPVPFVQLSYRRKNDEGIIKFVLDGLKEAALKVISK